MLTNVFFLNLNLEAQFSDISGYLDDKKEIFDREYEVSPYDDVRYYAYEGDGNSGGSLSSLASCNFLVFILIRYCQTEKRIFLNILIIKINISYNFTIYSTMLFSTNIKFFVQIGGGGVEICHGIFSKNRSQTWKILLQINDLYVFLIFLNGLTFLFCLKLMFY